VIVVDTSVLVDLLRGTPAALEWWPGVQSPVASEVTRTELLQGMRTGERADTDDLLDQLRWHPVDGPLATRAGALGRTYRRSHPGIGLADLCVAATADLLGLGLATMNVRHFPMVAGLQPPY